MLAVDQPVAISLQLPSCQAYSGSILALLAILDHLAFDQSAAETCIDQWANCSQWASLNWCDRVLDSTPGGVYVPANLQIQYTTCRKSCGNCNGGSSPYTGGRQWPQRARVRLHVTMIGQHLAATASPQFIRVMRQGCCFLSRLTPLPWWFAQVLPPTPTSSHHLCHPLQRCLCHHPRHFLVSLRTR